MGKLWHDENTTRISQSVMEAYFQCPARVEYMSQWRSTCPSPALRDGTDTHALLAGEHVPEASPTAVAYYESLFELAALNGIEVWKHEHVQEFLLEEGIWFKRIIDGIGLWQGRPVIIDWKTSSKGPWPYFRNGRDKVVPKGKAFQAVGYLIPPPRAEVDRFGLDEWPDTFVFVVSDTQGHGELVVYERDPEMEANFYAAARTIDKAIRMGNFPKVYGGACGVRGTSWCCNYLELCYQLPGWEQMYEREGK